MPTLQQKRLLLPVLSRGPAILRTNLLAEYRFAGNANDSGPSGFNASLGGAASLESFGVRMATDADFVSFPAGAQVADKLDHTLQIVFRVPVPSTPSGDLVYVEGNSGSTEFIYLNRGNTVGNTVSRYRRVTATSYDQNVNIAAANPTNTWMLVTQRRSGTSVTVYINNRTLTGSATIGSAALPTRTLVRLNNGGGVASLANPGRPDVAYLVSYTAALSDADISANYAAIKTYLAARGVSLP